MTDRFESEDFEDQQQFAVNRLASIKPTDSDEAHRLGLLPANIDLPDGMKLYVLHAEDGSVLGFTDGYASAYGAAVQNQFTPVSLH
jgi:hypothetical protein